MGGPADLHLHTLFSDGALAPRTLVERARRAGLTVIALTDHDHTGGLAEARAASADGGPEIVPGIEFSTSIEGREVHILGYFIDPGHPPLASYLAFVRDERRKRAERIVGKLHALKMPVSLDDVFRRAGEGAVGRPHVAAALVDGGFVSSVNEAFARFLANGRPAYEEKYRSAPQEVFRLVAGAGGLSFVAHPGEAIDGPLLHKLITEGVDGIEVVHPSHTPERTAHYRGIAAEYCLLASGGSDFHGGKRNDDDALGRFTIPDEFVQAMKHRLHKP
jgi:predicted metal-dependent phosphoesterase TrpH